MHYLALATDYDGTIAHDGVVDDATIAALERFRASTRKLILVTGRELPDLARTLPRMDLFDLIVAENGALLYDPASHEEHTLASPPPPRFIEHLRELAVEPLSAGRIIVATWEPNETKVLTAIRDLGLDLQITFNKGAVMVLPGGVTKASGLRAALDHLGLSPVNCVGVGDAENDLAFLEICGLPVAVANALPAVKERVALVTDEVRGAGVQALVDRILATDLAELDTRSQRMRVALGRDENGEDVLYAPHRESILLTGQSGGGKTSLAHGLLERIAKAGFQWCILDPEGDYEGIEDAVMEGTAETRPVPAQVLNLLRKTSGGVVVNLLAVPFAERPGFFAELLPELLAARARFGRPHVVVADEAHHLMPKDWDPGAATLPSDLEGFLFLTITPDHVSRRVTGCVDRLMVVGAEAAKSAAMFRRTRGLTASADDPQPAKGDVLVIDARRGGARMLQIIPGSGDRRRHRRKYAEGRLAEDTSFWFRGPEGKLRLRAYNLNVFMDMADGVDEATWEFHRRRGDYSEWLRTCVKDPDLANDVAILEKSDADPDLTRRQVREAIERRYTAPA